MANSGVDYTGKKVVVGLTGRIGSAVTALLLKKQGMDVIGLSIVTNASDSFSDNKLYPKCHIDNLDAVKKFCEDLKIPFYATDGKAQFDADVLDPLVANKLTAQANVSCFNCTKMRLDILLKKMVSLKADYIATGHFCKIQKNLNSDEFFVHANNDRASDQSFLLAGLDTKFLKHLILPLGELKQAEIEKIAQKFQLKILDSKKQVGFCFTEKESFLKTTLSKVPKSMLKEGQVYNVDTDLFHGDHDGIVHHYVTEKNVTFKGNSHQDRNLEIVGYDFVKAMIKVGLSQNLSQKGFQVIDLKLSKGLDRKKPITCFIKTKFSDEYYKAHLFFKNNQSALIELEDEIYPLILGEFVVIFDRDSRNAKVIGLGKIGNIGQFELIDRVDEFRSRDNDELVKKTSELFRF